MRNEVRRGERLSARRWNNTQRDISANQTLQSSSIRAVRTSAGTMLSVRGAGKYDCVRLIIQDTEPDPESWPQGAIWINTSSLVDGEYYRSWFKTEHDTDNNDSKIELSPKTLLDEIDEFRPICQAAEPAAAVWHCGQLWIDTNDTHSGINQVWVKTVESAVSNASKVAIALMR